jgi:hypothetical protein
MERVRSVASHARNVTASSTANRIVVLSGTTRSSSILSLSRVPTTLMSTTDIQQTPGT